MTAMPTAKGPSVTDAPLMNTLQPVGQPLAGLSNASAQIQAPQNVQPQSAQSAFQKMMQPTQPAQFQPAQFGAPGASGQQLSQFITALMQNQGGNNGA